MTQSDPDQWHAQGIAAYNAGDYDRAEQCITAAIQAQAGNAHFHVNLGAVFIAKGRYVAAHVALSEATTLDPEISVAHYLKAMALQEMGQRAGAFESIETSLQLHATYVPALLLRANLLAAQGQVDAAIRDYHHALQLDSKNALVHFNLGCALSAQGRLEEAIEAFDAALSLHPQFVQALCNKANAQRDLLQTEQAHAAYESALALDPQNHSLWWNLALLQLQQGDYRAGWKNYEHRLQDETPTPLPHSAKTWTGTESLQGQRILVRGEQGLGDMIQFARYIPLLIQRGAHVVVQVPQPLVSLLANISAEHVTAIAMNSEPPEVDYACMMMSLPHAFGTELDTVPVPCVFPGNAYLQPGTQRVAKWRAQLAPLPRPRIGLVTRGNPKNPRDKQRSVQLSALLPFLSTQVHYVLLHDALNEDDASVLKRCSWIQSVHQDLHDLEDVAAACLCLDGVIAVDTAVAHLSGALGLPTWVMIPFASDWRWLLGRTDSPWYPSMRLLRQSAPNNWQSVFEQLRHERHS